MLTEEKAKTRWCPFARQPYTIGDRVSNVVGNRILDENGELAFTCCIGSACMAWQSAGMKGIGPTDDPTAPEEPIGYCSMFGRPE